MGTNTNATGEAWEGPINTVVPTVVNKATTAGRTNDVATTTVINEASIDEEADGIHHEEGHDNEGSVSGSEESGSQIDLDGDDEVLTDESNGVRLGIHQLDDAFNRLFPVDRPSAMFEAVDVDSMLGNTTAMIAVADEAERHASHAEQEITTTMLSAAGGPGSPTTTKTAPHQAMTPAATTPADNPTGTGRRPTFSEVAARLRVVGLEQPTTTQTPTSQLGARAAPQRQPGSQTLIRAMMGNRPTAMLIIPAKWVGNKYPESHHKPKTAWNQIKEDWLFDVLRVNGHLEIFKMGKMDFRCRKHPEGKWSTATAAMGHAATPKDHPFEMVELARRALEAYKDAFPP